MFNFEGLLLIKQMEKGTSVPQGYEPKAMERSSSLPPNPFWSERARMEHRLVESRPEELPIPDDEGLSEGEGEGRADSPVPIKDQKPLKSKDEAGSVRDAKSRRRSRSAPRGRKEKVDKDECGQSDQGLKFHTPASWENPTGKGRGGGTSGGREVTGSIGNGGLSEEVASQLQQDIERAMFAQMRKEKEELQQQVSRLEAKLQRQQQQKPARTPRSNTPQCTQRSHTPQCVQFEEPVLPPPTTPPRQTPMMTPMSPSQAPRYTPGGTRVPPGPPPEELPPVPAWPASLGFYEVAHEDGRRLGCRDERGWTPAMMRHKEKLEEWHYRGRHGRGRWAAARPTTTYRDDAPPPSPQHQHLRPKRKTADSQHHTTQETTSSSEEAAREREERRQYWQRPVMKEDGSRSASGYEAALLMRQAAEGMGKKMYTQEEVDKMMREFEETRRTEEDKVKRGDRGDEGLRSFQVTLPPLPEPHVTNASLEAGDWLTQVKPLISDVSPHASEWWEAVLKATDKQYQLWLTATPLEKLKVKPPDATLLVQGYERLAQRIAVLLMQALPAGLRQELVSARQMDATSILFRIYKTYQPGGLAERRHTLSQLTNTATAATPTEAVASLRLWRRQAQRAAELKATMPDAVLQVRALTAIMEGLLAQDSQASFRVSSHRMANGIDVAPTDADIGLFYDLLLAEAEHMVTSTAASANPSSSENTPQIKALQHNPNSKAREAPCKYWSQESGCKAGRSCRFLHDWHSLPDKHDRCFLCAAKGHRRHECPTLTKEGQPQTAAGGSGAGGDHKQAALSDGGGKAKGKGKTKGKTSGKGANAKGEGKSTETKSEDKKEEAEDAKPSIKAERQVTSPKEEATGVTNNQEALMSEVTSLLRSIRVQGGEPTVRAIQLRSMHEEGGGHTLIDGGATHCLRQRRTQEEWLKASPVSVKLAAGETKMRQCEDTTTLLVEEPVQAIIPVAKVIDLGYVVHWDRDACRIEHVRHGKIPVEMSQGCPTVPREWGEKLMAEVEDAERKKGRLRAIMKSEVVASNDHEKSIAELKAMFPQVPVRILERIPGEKEWDPDQVPYNRRRRRQIEQAKMIVINMCSGPNEERWREVEKRPGVVVLNLDVLLGVNVMDPHVGGWLESVIATGKVVFWTSGPPCRTVSFCRQRGEKDGGPKPLRAREGELRFGLPGITASMQEQADHDAALWLKNLWYMTLVKRANPQAEVMAEQPRDPDKWQTQIHNCPTFLVWPETQQVIQDLQLSAIKFCQGRMGHQTSKPTTVLTDIPELHHLQDQPGEAQSKTWPEDVRSRIAMSKALAAWAPGLVEVLKIAMKRKVAEVPWMKAISSKEKEAIREWRTHVDMNHMPYRKDCSICVESMGKDRPHRRQKNPAPFTLSLDIGGPFVEGVDQVMYHKPKYILIGVMTIPMWGGRPMVEGLRTLSGDEEPMVLPQPPQDDDEDVEAPPAVFSNPGSPQQEPLGSPPQAVPGHPPPEASGAPQQSPAPEEVDPFQGQDDRQLEESEAKIKVLDEKNQKWKEFIAECADLPVKSLTMAVPIRSRRAKDAIKGVAQIMARLRAMHIPITRIHTDRAQEFCGKDFQDWLAHRDLWHTTTAGDEPSANARAENQLKLLKGRTRTLMKTAKCELTYWPLALRYASEERFRTQLRECGVPAPPMLPFGIRAYAKKKAWQDKHAMWRSPMMAVRVWGPACDMSMTSKGYFLQVEGTAQFMRSTVIVIPKQSPTVLDPILGGAPMAPSPAEAVAPPPAPQEDEALMYSPSLGPDDLDHPGDLLDDDANPGELELALEEPPASDRGIPPHDPPRRRVYGKKGPQFYDGRPFEPTLRHLKVGGEYDVTPLPFEEEDKWLQWYSQWRNQEKEQELAVFEHSGLVDWIKEERQGARDPQTIHAMLEAEKMMSQLEAQLERDARLSKEYDALVAGPVTPIFDEEWKEMERQGIPAEVLPAKAIASKKPPNRRKGRVVVCGNFTEDRDGQGVSVGGVCAMAVRGMVHVATCKNWAIGSIDVTGAFLQAPRRQKATVSIVQPPRLLHQLGITKGDEKWRVNCALYGFVESPADWANFRDAELERMTWDEGDWHYWLERTPEQHLWKVKKVRKNHKENQGGCTAGWVAVYVDDF
eukprot:s75_g32.t3